MADRDNEEAKQPQRHRQQNAAFSCWLRQSQMSGQKMGPREGHQAGEWRGARRGLKTMGLVALHVSDHLRLMTCVVNFSSAGNRLLMTSAHPFL
jgi:hypothetical protein